jgi:N-glycosylase/DNA lyase
MSESDRQMRFPVRDYDLAATLNSGQTFRWEYRDGFWENVIGSRWVRLSVSNDSILAETSEPVASWDWLSNYLQTDVDLEPILAAFPKDEPMCAAAAACRGLRLLRQNTWECLASFILSSTKQIVQIQQIVSLLCERFGQNIPVRPNHRPWRSFPSAARLAECGETELRACKMGFRAPYLQRAAAMVAVGEVNLDHLGGLEVAAARTELLKLPGVGRKIADCVLLFAYGFQDAFPVDVWVMKALRELYFRRRRVKLQRLQRFAASHFGPYSGYAQQYLFHYMRTRDNPGKPTVQKRTALGP